MLEPFQCRPYDPRQLEAAVAVHNPSEFVEALIDQGLAPLWSDFIDTEFPNLRINEQIHRELRQQRMASAAMYMLQTRSAARVCRCLADARIPCAIFKGFVLRERLFSKPDARPADDIDVLIPAEQRNAAITALVNAGYRFRGKADTISHEAMLQDGPVAVDLHWYLFRPGRSRIELAPILMQKTRTDGPFTGLDDDASLLVMLVHPAFTKHVNGRLSKLVRVVELDRMLRRTEPDWDWILKTIDTAGVRTAAWSRVSK